jgi:hypothetical protein
MVLPSVVPDRLKVSVARNSTSEVVLKLKNIGTAPLDGTLGSPRRSQARARARRTTRSR